MNRDRPFDARLQLLSDRRSVEPAWSTVSLVTALREYVLREPSSIFPPTDEHAALLARCAGELTSRGLDASSLVRYGLLPELIGGMLSCVMQQLLEPESVENNPRAAKAQAWLDRLEPRLTAAGVAPTSLRAADLGTFFGSVIGDLLPWLLVAPLDQLLSLEPPTEEALRGLPEPGERDQELLIQYRWAVDRFSVTRLEDWSDESLSFELKWLCNSERPPCSPALMDEQDVDRAVLESEIARRAVFPREESPTHRRLRSSLASRMTRQAAELLRGRRFHEAIALFEFAVLEDPHDASALNNLGFCRLPKDPRAAREPLNQAAQLGYQPMIVNLYNRVLCTLLLSGPQAALALAGTEWDQVAGQSRTAAYLWDISENDLVLTDLVDAHTHLASLATSLASTAGRAADAAAWQARADSAA